MRSLTLVALIAVPAFAQTVYSWEDAEGIHYTDDRSQIPKDKKVEGVVVDPHPASSGLSATPAQAPLTVALAPVAPSASNEREWRERFVSAHRRIDSAHRTVSALQSSLPARIECVPQPGLRTVATGTASPRHLQSRPRCQVNPLYDQLQVQIAQTQVELRDAQLDLEQLDRDASLAAVPREWRRGW